MVFFRLFKISLLFVSNLYFDTKLVPSLTGKNIIEFQRSGDVNLTDVSGNEIYEPKNTACSYREQRTFK